MAAHLAAAPAARAEVLKSLPGCGPRGVLLQAALDPGSVTIPASLPEGFVDRAGLLSLARNRTAAATDERLRTLGFTPAYPGASSLAVDARSVLEDWGRVHPFDVETGQFPNEHDTLLRELAAIASLEGWTFEEKVVGDFEGASYTLVAYPPSGSPLRVEAADNGDWYDMEAVMFLMDKALRGHDQALHVLYTGDQTMAVVAGPAAGLKTLVGDGELSSGDQTSSMKTGKAFEDEVFKQLREEGKDVQRDVAIPIP